MIRRNERIFYTSLLLSAIFVFKQLGVCLFLCAVFHAHSHDGEEMIVIPANDPEICCLHCDHTCNGHTHINNISYTTLQEKEQVFDATPVSDAQIFSGFRFCIVSNIKFSDCGQNFQTISPPLQSTVMRC